ncbi:copine-8-like [Dysidea avara]|uniref:copine-8-like n=1 Tax=Dysidea avara TaxID=196820 RepID=UPI0033341F91
MGITNVAVTVSCSNLTDKTALSNGAVMCCLFLKDDSKVWKNVGVTEVVWNTDSPRFANGFTILHHPRGQGDYKLVVYVAKNESLVGTLLEKFAIGEAEFTVEELITSEYLEVDLTHHGKVVPKASLCIWGEVYDNSKYDITMQLFCTKLNKKGIFNKIDTFLEISKLQRNGMFTLVHRTDVAYNTSNPRWSTFSEPVSKLCSNQWDRQLLFSVYQYNRNGNHDMLGYFYTSLEEICSPEEYGDVYIKEIKLMSKGRKKYETVGTLHFGSIRAVPIYSMHDYFKNGFSVKLTVAMDFTASNGKQTSPDSLHYFTEYQDNNEYIYCLKTLRLLMDECNYNSSIAAYGFGGHSCDSKTTSSCTALNENPDNPNIDGIENVIKAYKDHLKSIELDGPADCSAILDKAIEQALISVSREDKIYHHLVILTNNVMTDKSLPVEKLVLTSGLPLFITIVGIGGSDFSKMSELNDSVIVQDVAKFVPLRLCIHRTGTYFSLSHELQESLSSHFLKYMKKHVIKPRTFRASLSSLSSAVSQCSELEPYLQRSSISSVISSISTS